MITRLAIDSYIPVREGRPIFAESVRNSVFPCLYEKLLAKVCGCYESVTGSLIDVLQLFTFYHRQVVPFYDYRLQPDRLTQMLVQAHSAQSLVFYRTRNSVRLETVGLASDCEYIITRVVKVQGKWIAEFLEIDGTSWIGKFSKMRAYWQLEH